MELLRKRNSKTAMAMFGNGKEKITLTLSMAAEELPINDVWIEVTYETDSFYDHARWLMDIVTKKCMMCMDGMKNNIAARTEELLRAEQTGTREAFAKETWEKIAVERVLTDGVPRRGQSDGTDRKNHGGNRGAQVH